MYIYRFIFVVAFAQACDSIPASLAALSSGGLEMPANDSMQHADRRKLGEIGAPELRILRIGEDGRRRGKRVNGTA